MGRVHIMLGTERLKELLRTDILQFVRLRRTEVVIFPADSPELVGSLGTIELPENTDQHGREVSLRELVHRHVQPFPGKEHEAESVRELIERNVLDPTPSDGIPIAKAVRGLLLRPSVREALGMSGGVPVAAVPRWMMFPVLRLS
jgi:hypothetical protein